MQTATVMTADVSLLRLAQALGMPIPERHAPRAALVPQESAMHTTIAIPSDVSLTDLAKALGSIGLKAAREVDRIPTFDRALNGHRPPCQIDDCARDAAASDGPVNLCPATGSIAGAILLDAALYQGLIPRKLVARLVYRPAEGPTGGIRIVQPAQIKAAMALEFRGSVCAACADIGTFY